mmetsp:Transcript_1690/g.10385  ORF Transcript_1690/g.10385 Transcript_1690/m.10385 type:complete len:213 (-) Transcript_1690:2540-3178(-)
MDGGRVRLRFPPRGWTNHAAVRAGRCDRCGRSESGLLPRLPRQPLPRTAQPRHRSRFCLLLSHLTGKIEQGKGRRRNAATVARLGTGTESTEERWKKEDPSDTTDTGIPLWIRFLQAKTRSKPAKRRRPEVRGRARRNTPRKRAQTPRMHCRTAVLRLRTRSAGTDGARNRHQLGVTAVRKAAHPASQWVHHHFYAATSELSTASFSGGRGS